MPAESRRELCEEVGRAVAEFQSAGDLVDDAIALYLGVNRTDLRCLGLLWSHGPMSAGRLARASSLSPGATTSAIDRLERAGYVRRVRHPADRRGVVVELTSEAQRLIVELYGPIGEAGQARLTKFSDEQLVFLRDFLREGRLFQMEQAERVRAKLTHAAGPSE